MEKDSFPPLKKRKGGKTFRLECGHCQDSLVRIDNKINCYACNKKSLNYEIKEIPTINGYLCWDCQCWINEIPINIIEGNLRCSNCGSMNKINNSKKRDPIESRLRHEVFKRDEYKCIECGKGKKETTLHCDHIIPVAQGGNDELDNLQTLCQACNLAKSNRKWKGGDEDGK